MNHRSWRRALLIILVAVIVPTLSRGDDDNLLGQGDNSWLGDVSPDPGDAGTVVVPLMANESARIYQEIDPRVKGSTGFFRFTMTYTCSADFKYMAAGHISGVKTNVNNAHPISTADSRIKENPFSPENTQLYAGDSFRAPLIITTDHSSGVNHAHPLTFQQKGNVMTATCAIEFPVDETSNLYLAFPIGTGTMTITSTSLKPMTDAEVGALPKDNGSSLVLPPPLEPAPPGTELVYSAIPTPGVSQVDEVRPNIDLPDLVPLWEARHRPMDLLFDGTIFARCIPRDNDENSIWNYKKLNAANFGYMEQVQNVLWRLQHGELMGQHPRLIVLSAGLENLLDLQPPADVAAGIKLCVDEYRKACPDAHVVLMGVFPFKWRNDNSIALDLKAVAQTNALLAKLDDGQHVTFPNLNSKLMRPPGATSDFAPTNFYDTLADALQPFVDQYLPASGVSAPPNSAAINSEEPALYYPWPTQPPAGVPVATFPVPLVPWLDSYIAVRERLSHDHYDAIFEGGGLYGDSSSGYWLTKSVQIGEYNDYPGSIIWRLKHNELKGQNPKLVVLTPMSFDVAYGPEAPKGPVKSLHTLVDEYEKVCPNAHIVLFGFVPTNRFDPAEYLKFYAAVNDQLKNDFSADPKVTFLDTLPDYIDEEDHMNSNVGYGDGFTESERAKWFDAVKPLVHQYCPAAK